MYLLYSIILLFTKFLHIFCTVVDFKEFIIPQYALYKKTTYNLNIKTLYTI